MAFTRHGHQIPGTTAEPRPDDYQIARCGGVHLCPGCMVDMARAEAEASSWHEDITAYNEGTLFKVRDALYRAGLTKVECTEAIQQMQNAGILFREKLPYI